MSKLTISNVGTIDKAQVGNGDNFQANVGSFSTLFGMKGLGCNVVELEPGKKAWPYHLHYGHEELFVIVKGNGSIRFDDEIYPVKEGDVIYTPPGEGTAHQIINSSDAPLQYLALSTKQNPEICYYPDSEKYGSYFSTPGATRGAFIAHESGHTDYFEGEDS
jgi:uncharacterized cupin superfamily protein